MLVCLTCVYKNIIAIYIVHVVVDFKMGKKDKSKKRGKGIEKTAAKTDKKLSQKQKKELAAIGEVCI